VFVFALIPKLTVVIEVWSVHLGGYVRDDDQFAGSSDPG
jgi:hypothetical protein